MAESQRIIVNTIVPEIATAKSVAGIPVDFSNFDMGFLTIEVFGMMINSLSGKRGIVRVRPAVTRCHRTC